MGAPYDGFNAMDQMEADGAGEGNRTLVFSLEGCCSTIELHPRLTQRIAETPAGANGGGGWWER